MLRKYERPPNHVIVLYGATGDLARRKIIPGLFHLSSVGLMPQRYRIVGVSRGRLSDDEMRATALLSLQMFGPKRTRATDRMNFCHRILGSNQEDVPEVVARAEKAIGRRPRRLFQLAIPPSAFESVIEQLAASGLSSRARVIVEKPFGTDYASSRELNRVVHSAFGESEVFRIDHFLGKESVENILALRFANGLFEPVWNRDHIDHVQIDVPETLSIEGRAGFYEGTGAFRDMVVTHLFQVLGFVAMEPPTSLESRALRVEKNKVFEAMRPLKPSHVVRGQYEGYRKEPGVARNSHDGDVRRARGADRQLALGRRPVLPAHWQEHGRGPADGLARVPRAAAAHVPAGARAACVAAAERADDRVPRPRARSRPASWPSSPARGSTCTR